jgi:methionine synthase I (cobalamin-dependent)
MSRLLDAIRSGNVLLMDGAMGTELIRAGLPPAECGESWNLTDPDRVRAIHQGYVNAGAEVLLTNTFQANPLALARHGLQDQLAAIVLAGIDIARSVAGPERFVLADIGPVVLGDAEEQYEAMESVASALIPHLARIDGILLETWSDLRLRGQILALAIELATADPDLPLLVSFSFRRDPANRFTDFSGHSWLECFQQGDLFGADLLGVNCGKDIGIDEITDIVSRYRRLEAVGIRPIPPLFARPNAGTPARAGDDWIYPQTPETMAGRLPALLAAGVCMVGGCCGTTPEHIAAFRKVVDAWTARE